MKLHIDRGSYSRADIVRYFFALLPDPALAESIRLFAAKEAARHDGAAALLAPERLHMTVAITDDIIGARRDVEDRLMAVGAGVAAEKFALPLVGLRETSRSVALVPHGRQDAARALHEGLAAGMRRAQVGMRAEWRFSPHMTLFYRSGVQTQTALKEGFVLDCDRFVLIRSHVGRTRHDPLASWPLQSDGGQGSLF